MISEISTSKPKILIVDDELSIRVTLSEFLKDADYEVAVAEDAGKAMEMLTDGDFDVVVTDIIMPRITGVKLLESIRENAPRVQVIMMTGEPTVGTASEAVRSGAFDYLTKPISKDEINRTVANAVKIKSLDDERRRLQEENYEYQENLEEMIKQRTKALKVSEKKYRALFEESGDANLIIQNELFIDCNQATIEMLGYTSKTEFLHTHPADLSPELQPDGKKSLEKANKMIQIALDKGSHRFEWMHKRANGETFPVEVLLTNISSEKGVGVIHTVWRDITDRKQVEHKVNRQHQFTNALREIDAAITSSFNLKLTLNILLDHVSVHLKIDAAIIFLFNRHSNLLTYETGIGFSNNSSFKDRSIKLGDSFAGQVALDRKLLLSNFKNAVTSSDFSKSIKEEQFVSYAGLPLIAKGEVLGVLEVYKRTPLEPDPEWIGFFESLASQAAIAIDNITLFENLQQSNLELTLGYNQTIEGWAKTLEMRDSETEGHSQRVTDLTVKLANHMGMNAKEIVHMRRGALLHDIGKMNIPDMILQKDGPLNDEEWAIMHQHPEIAYKFLSPINFLKSALDIPRYHHEKWDGSGYPFGLKDKQIPLAARIFAVVDVYDALLSDRPYRKTWTMKKTINYIKEQSGKHFDPEVVEVFLQIYKKNDHA